MDNESLMATENPRSEINWSVLRSLQYTLSGLLLVVCLFIYAATDLGGYFWPIWVVLGLGLPIGLRVAFRSIKLAPRPWKGLVAHSVLSACAAAIVTYVWLMTGFGFWLFWPLFGLTIPIAMHALITTSWLHNRKDTRELNERVDVLTRTRRGALDVQAAELRRIERDLHDGAQARLVALSMQIGRAEARVEDQPEVAELLRNARTEASAAIKELRDLARGIAPPVLADRGLVAAVDALGKRSALPVSLDAQISRRLPPVVENAAYFVVAEALTNAAKHAHGASAHVILKEEHGRLIVEVDDEGPGGANPRGSGLQGLKARVEALDGILLVRSNPGEGTTIYAELPCES
jgi:signal transduction histidine kinase